MLGCKFFRNCRHAKSKRNIQPYSTVFTEQEKCCARSKSELHYKKRSGLKKNIVCFRFPTDSIKTCATQIYFMDFQKKNLKKLKIYFFRESIL